MTGFLAAVDPAGGVLLHVMVAAVASDLATGLGALPFAFLPAFTVAWQKRASAAAGGMMVAVSVFSLAGEALHRGHPWELAVGMLAGAGFLSGSAWLVHRSEYRIAGLSASDSRRGILVFLVMLAHSFPEGVAIGVGYATGELTTGALIAVAIAIHNVPEGIAISLPLRAKGVSVARCAWYSVLSSVPQPVAALPAFLLVSWFRPLLPAGLGFAAGAMIFLVVTELLPEALNGDDVSPYETGWWFMFGVVGMVLLTGLLQV